MHTRSNACTHAPTLQAFSTTTEPVSEERARSSEAWALTDVWAYEVDAQGAAHLSQPAPAG